MGREKDHAHWSLHGKRFRMSWSLWWDYDRRNFDCPIEVHINTPKKRYLIRPFSKAQAYDWSAGKWTGTKENRWDDIMWKHVVVSPQRPGTWEKING